MMRNGASSSGFQEQSKKMINGPRPSPLKINKDSHLIRKNQHRVPIIIYTQSPKVIHTTAHEFMDLVQRLTGMSTSSNQNIITHHQPNQDVNNIISDEICVKREDDGDSLVKWDSNIDQSSSSNNILGFADMPFYTPNSSDFFSTTSRSTFKCSDHPYGILGSLISPSGLDFMKELPEY